jgi:hypothetical protein
VALRVCMPLLAAIADSRQRFAKPVCALRLQLVWRGLMIVAIALMFSAVRAALRCAALPCVAWQRVRRVPPQYTAVQLQRAGHCACGVGSLGRVDRPTQCITSSRNSAKVCPPVRAVRSSYSAYR